MMNQVWICVHLVHLRRKYISYVNELSNENEDEVCVLSTWIYKSKEEKRVMTIEKILLIHFWERTAFKAIFYTYEIHYYY